MLPERILTARLRLRPVLPEDEAAVVAALNDLEVTRWLAVVPHPYAPEDFRWFLGNMARPGECFGIEDDDGLAGIVSAGRTLGYWLVPRAHGRGYATEAARGVLAERLARDPSPVESGYFEGNARSARVLEKLGFNEVGRFMKHCRALDCERPHVEMRLEPAAFRP